MYISNFRSESMKKLLTLWSVLILAIFLAACDDQGNETNDTAGNNAGEETTEDTNNTTEDEDNEAGDNETPSDNTDVPDEAQSQDDMKNMMAALDFNEIEIEISYGKDQEYEAEIEHHDNGDIEAEVEDEINGVDLNNDLEAFNHLYPYVKQLEITPDSEKQEVIDQVLNVFELVNDYEKFEIEFTFEDGKKLSFED